jgi:hypothetical protein
MPLSEIMQVKILLSALIQFQYDRAASLCINPCQMAFSTNGCNSNGGTKTLLASMG